MSVGKAALDASDMSFLFSHVPKPAWHMSGYGSDAVVFLQSAWVEPSFAGASCQR